MARCVAIVTVGRSGSSALAGALHAAGLSFGPQRELIPPHREHNPKGHFEMHTWYDNGQAIAAAVRSGVPPATDNLTAIRDIIQARNDEGVWGVKSTTFPWTLPHLIAYMPEDTRLVVLHRAFMGIVNSVMKHGGGEGRRLEKSLAERRTLRNLEALYRTVNRLSYLPQIHVQFEELTTHPDVVLPAVVNFAFYGIDPQPAPERIARGVEWIEPTLRHW